MNTDTLKKIGIPLAIVLGFLAIIMVVAIALGLRNQKNERSMAEDIVTKTDEGTDIPLTNAAPTNDITFLYSNPVNTNTVKTVLPEDGTAGTNDAAAEETAEETTEPETTPVKTAAHTATTKAPRKTVKKSPSHTVSHAPASVKKTPPHATAPKYTSAPRTASSSKPVITDIILDYNKQRTASAAEPLLVTFAAATPAKAKFADVRIFARRIKGTSILSRDLIHAMYKIYAIAGKTQTQFYWTGKDTAGRTLAKGTYLIYAECEAFDANCRRVGASGRYPLPKWSWTITVR